MPARDNGRGGKPTSTNDTEGPGDQRRRSDQRARLTHRPRPHRDAATQATSSDARQTPCLTARDFSQNVYRPTPTPETEQRAGERPGAACKQRPDGAVQGRGPQEGSGSRLLTPLCPPPWASSASDGLSGRRWKPQVTGMCREGHLSPWPSLPPGEQLGPSSPSTRTRRPPQA